MINSELRTLIRMNNRKRGRMARLAMPLLTPNGPREHLRLLMIEPFRLVFYDTQRDSFRSLQISGDPAATVLSHELRGAKEICIRFIREMMSERFLDRDEEKAQADRLARMRAKTDRWKG